MTNANAIEELVRAAMRVFDDIDEGGTANIRRETLRSLSQTLSAVEQQLMGEVSPRVTDSSPLNAAKDDNLASPTQPDPAPKEVSEEELVKAAIWLGCGTATGLQVKAVVRALLFQYTITEKNNG